MKKLILVLLLLLGLGGVAYWMWRTPARPAVSAPPQAAALPRVTASGYVPYALAREVGGDQIALSMLVPAGAEPHSFEPTPASIIAVDGADLFVYVSPRLEPWVGDILKGLGPVPVLAAGPSEDGQDPHVWMTPAGAAAMAARIASALAQRNPAQAAYYAKNLENFENKMQQLDADFTADLRRCQSRDVVHVGHLAFGRLARAYGLDLRALSGTSHQGEHSVKKLTDLVRFIRQSGAKAVFTEETLSQDLVNAVAAETGAAVLPLYTVESVGKKDFDAGVSYEDFMRRNLQNLREGLQCAA